MIITGGYYTESTVTRYGENGYISDLPTLNTGRYSHGCTSFITCGKKVILYLCSWKMTVFFLLVLSCGGWT